MELYRSSSFALLLKACSKKRIKKSQAVGKIKASRKLKDDESFSTVEKEEIPPSFDVKKDIEVRNWEIKHPYLHFENR